METSKEETCWSYLNSSRTGDVDSISHQSLTLLEQDWRNISLHTSKQTQRYRILLLKWWVLHRQMRLGWHYREARNTLIDEVEKGIPFASFSTGNWIADNNDFAWINGSSEVGLWPPIFWWMGPLKWHGLLFSNIWSALTSKNRELRTAPHLTLMTQRTRNKVITLWISPPPINSIKVCLFPSFHKSLVTELNFHWRLQHK